MKGGDYMACFKIEIDGDTNGTIGWTTKVYDDDRQGEVDFSYLYRIGEELEAALKKINSERQLQLKNYKIIRS